MERNRYMWKCFFELCHAKFSIVSPDIFFFQNVPLVHENGDYFIRKSFYVILLNEDTEFISRPVLPYYFIREFPFTDLTPFKDVQDIWEITSNARNNYGEEYYSFEFLDGDPFHAFPAITTDNEFGLIGADSSYFCFCDKIATFKAYQEAFYSSSIRSSSFTF